MLAVVRAQPQANEFDTLFPKKAEEPDRHSHLLERRINARAASRAKHKGLSIHTLPLGVQHQHQGTRLVDRPPSRQRSTDLKSRSSTRSPTVRSRFDSPFQSQIASHCSTSSPTVCSLEDSPRRSPIQLEEAWPQFEKEATRHAESHHQEKEHVSIKPTFASALKKRSTFMSRRSKCSSNPNSPCDFPLLSKRGSTPTCVPAVWSPLDSPRHLRCSSMKHEEVWPQLETEAKPWPRPFADLPFQENELSMNEAGKENHIKKQTTAVQKYPSEPIDGRTEIHCAQKREQVESFVKEQKIIKPTTPLPAYSRAKSCCRKQPLCTSAESNSVEQYATHVRPNALALSIGATASNRRKQEAFHDQLPFYEVPGPLSSESGISNIEADEGEDGTSTSATVLDSELCHIMAKRHGLNLENVKLCWREFRDLDLNGDGVLSKSEFKRSVRVMCNMNAVKADFLERQWEALVASRREDQHRFSNACHDQVDFEDFLLWSTNCFDEEIHVSSYYEKTIRKVRRNSGLHTLDIEKASTAFRRFDMDGNGTISYQEFKHVLATVFKAKSLDDISEKTCLRHFNAIDTDGSGEINLEEFLNSQLAHTVINS